MQWQATTVETQRLQRELDKLQLKFDDCIQERSNFETKLLHARRLLESESKERRRLVCMIRSDACMLMLYYSITKIHFHAGRKTVKRM